MSLCKIYEGGTKISLDVSLTGPEYDEDCTCECGHKHTRKKSKQYFSSNITHNLGKMAEAAGIYKCCWRPEEIGIIHASQLIELLTNGIELLEAEPNKFKRFDSPNGWGLYEHFVPWVREYLEACKKYPDSFVNADR